MNSVIIQVATVAALCQLNEPGAKNSQMMTQAPTTRKANGFDVGNPNERQPLSDAFNLGLGF
jgi:hypothetical protein